MHAFLRCCCNGFGASNSPQGTPPAPADASSEWQSVPDDVLRHVAAHLRPADVALARLTCSHWRAALSCYTPALTLPARFLGTKGSRSVLVRTCRVFPSASKVTLWHAGGWCDPVQARLDVEPLVMLERRNPISLEPLAAAFSTQVRQLSIADATFTRNPWCLRQLERLPQLSSLAVTWDTALWAPGQVEQEGKALKPIFGLSKLTALSLAKHAHVFLGEAPLGDSILAAAAASLTQLARLDLAVVAASDAAGFASLAALAGLTHLSLRGQLAVSLKSLSHVFSATTRLQTLELHGLLASSRDVRGIAAAHSNGAASSSGSTSGRDGSQPVGAGWASSRLWQQPQPEGTASPASAGSSCSRRTSLSSSVGSSIGSGRGAGRPAATAGRGRRRGSSSSSRGWGADWSAVLLPLRRLCTLKLQSDLALLGSCAALRSMSHVTHVELHGAATFLPGNGPMLAGLPLSWLAQLAKEAASGGEEPAAPERVWASSSMAAGAAARAGGAWPALVSLHVDNLLLADGFVGAVAQLANLRTLIVSGACLLAVPAAQPGGQEQPGGQQHQSQPHRGWRAAFPGLAGLRQLSPHAGAASDGSSSSAVPTAGAWDDWRQQPQHKPGDRQQAAAAALAAALKLAATQPLESSSGSTSTMLGSSSSSTTSGHSLGSQQRFNTSGMQAPQLPPVAPVLQPQHHALRPAHLDIDVLTQLSPLSRLGKFELHLQQQHQALQGMAMTPFALAHLSVSWTALTSLRLSVPAPEQAAPDAAGRSADCAAHQLFTALQSLACLKHLTLTLADSLPPPAARGGRAAPYCQHSQGPLPSTPEQGPDAPSLAWFGSSSSGSRRGSSGSSAAAAAAVAALPWQLLPAGLESLSLSGFVGVAEESIRALAAAAPGLRHLRLLHCQVPTSLLWALQPCVPELLTLIVKEDALGGISSSGVAAAAGLTRLRALGLTVAAGTDVRVLGSATQLRFLLLDGRANTEVRGIKGLRQLSRLKALVLPLLHLHHACRPALCALQLALPHTHIANVSRSFGQHHGSQWFRAFTEEQLCWWAAPAQPWAWAPTLDVSA